MHGGVICLGTAIQTSRYACLTNGGCKWLSINASAPLYHPAKCLTVRLTQPQSLNQALLSPTPLTRFSSLPRNPERLPILRLGRHRFTMRLLNVHTFQLESFLAGEEKIPPYAILSHTWGDVEIVFQDVKEKTVAELNLHPAFAKLEQGCRQAQQDGFTYIWVDTCCIDKSSSAELSEAINSMLKWYQQSSICYVFLNDFNVTSPSSLFASCATDPSSSTAIEPEDTSFFSCRWFDRGWTL